jgi:hypothetical protein
MPYAYMRKAPFDAETHRAVRDRIGDQVPKGLLVHLVFERDGGLEFIDVWESAQDWERFQAEQLGPAVAAVQGGRDAGAAPAPVASTPIEVVDLLVGSPEAIAGMSIV